VTTVLITGIGGSICIDVCRSLRADSSLRIVGGDASEWGLRIGERLCDDVVTLPRSARDAAAFASALDEVIADVGADFAFVNPDFELEALGEVGTNPCCAHAIPPPDVTAATLDKSATVARAGADAAELFPRGIELTGADDVDRAFAELTAPLWLRCSIGAGGKGSLAVANADEARAWIAYWTARGWHGTWLAQELLPGRNLNWTGLYVDGALVVETAMIRLAYFLGDAAPSGVSGQVARCATIDPAQCSSDSDRVVRAVDPRPHGLYSVDLREDADGHALITEINPRLAGRPWLYTCAGVNLPLAAMRALTGAPVGDAISPNGLEIGLHLHRQLDVEPTIDRPER